VLVCDCAVTVTLLSWGGVVAARYTLPTLGLSMDCVETLVHDMLTANALEFLVPATRQPCLHLRQDVPGIGLDFSLFAPSSADVHAPDSKAVARIVVRSGTLAGKPFRNSLSLSFTNAAAQPWQAGSSTASGRKVMLRLDTHGKRAQSDVVLVGEDGDGEAGEVVVARIRRVLVSSEERVDMVVGAGVDVRLVVALAACLKYRRRE
jgi:hypothetical protein